MIIAPKAEDEFNAWFNEEHLLVLQAVPGNLSARCFTMPDGMRRYLALHHLRSPDVQASAAWEMGRDAVDDEGTPADWRPAAVRALVIRAKDLITSFRNDITSSTKLAQETEVVSIVK